MSLGTYLREARERSGLSLTDLAAAVGINKGYVSRAERDTLERPPSADVLVRWANVLELDPDVVLAMSGQVSEELIEVICKRPQLFAEIIRSLKNAPNHALLRVAREVRDGDW